MNKQIPNDIHRIAAHDPVVKAFVSCWLNGGMTWEQCLISIICHMHPGYEAFNKIQLERLMKCPSPQETSST